MLNVSGLNQHYGGSHILRDVDVEVPAGACTCIVERNGVGKTTFVKSILGLVPTSGGRVQLNDRNISDKSTHQIIRAGVGYVPQGREIFARLTVRENIQVAMDRPRDPVPDFIHDYFPVLKEMAGRRGGDLSGGQQQQLAIARALVHRPGLLILDEPTEGIQPNIVQAIGRALRRLIEEEDLTVLLVEQKLPFVRRYSDRFIIFDNGRVVEQGETSGLNDEIVQQHLMV